AFRQYGLGNKTMNNGVLLVVAVKDRKIRIEVGYGLEGALPDGKVGRILDQYAIPYLKENKPDAAVINTYKKLAAEKLEINE
ncbi:TPM domain-containing protein, partial [Vibrio cholerae O1]